MTGKPRAERAGLFVFLIQNRWCKIIVGKLYCINSFGGFLIFCYTKLIK